MGEKGQFFITEGLQLNVEGKREIRNHCITVVIIAVDKEILMDAKIGGQSLSRSKIFAQSQSISQKEKNSNFIKRKRKIVSLLQREK